MLRQKNSRRPSPDFALAEDILGVIALFGVLFVCLGFHAAL